MKTHIEYPDIFFLKYNSPYHIEIGTDVLIDLLWAGGSVAPAQRTSFWWNWGIFYQTYSTCLEGQYRRDSSGVHPCRAIDRAWEPRITSPCSLKAITHATGSKIGSSWSHWHRAIDRAWEPRIPSPCSLKDITHATGIQNREFSVSLE